MQSMNVYTPFYWSGNHDCQEIKQIPHGEPNSDRARGQTFISRIKTRAKGSEREEITGDLEEGKQGTSWNLTASLRIGTLDHLGDYTGPAGKRVHGV